MKPSVEGFAGRIVRWQQSHGRHALPWQGTRDAYRVWLSEVMLQQTQVATVLAYYERFTARFAGVRALAAADEDEVLALWSGLGYYSRARNLHRCAQEVVARFGGEFPRTAAELETLPGIGRSTAAAIAAFCFGERVAILDGNVKRVLARVLAFDGDLANAKAVNELWSRAEALLPASEAMPRYTQGLMDLGATVCLPRNPSCLVCPAQDVCGARLRGNPEDFPVKTKKLKRTAQSLWLLRAHASDGAVWLHKRPAPGVWAGLYCLPVFDSREALEEALPAGSEASDGAAFKHVLTHKDLHLHPVEVRLPRKRKLQGEGDWFGAQQWPALGLPAPIRKLLDG
ncbi:A/G-specific adenine glycosylase [Ramlibacter sp. PS4R-6]|uniref:A/G-specific adenine glycosylase n=1 Tax=Ramlibacter sp. PS4R-6 TaxID=3133438 RepID=UPI0030A37E16